MRTKKMRQFNQKFIRILLVFLIVFGSFLIGFFIRGNSDFLKNLGLPEYITGVAKSKTQDLTTNKKNVFNSISARIDEVEDVLASDSLDTYTLEEATKAIFESLSKASNDPYLHYFSSDRYTTLMNTQDEGYAGVGVLFSEYNGKAYAVDVFEGSPAQLEGVRNGDFVESVNGDSSHVWSRSEVTALLNKSEGRSVVITWRRPESLESESGNTFITALECKEFKKENISMDFIEDRRIAVIDINQLTQDSASYVEEKINEALAREAQGFVLDLRDNPGGYLGQAIEIASMFIATGNVVQIETVDGVATKAVTGKPITNLPVVLLVNKNTAAAAEVMAAAIKESQRGLLVGTTTMGKGTIQVMYELTFGGAMRYTAAYYLTPGGHQINNVGITPDVVLGKSEEGDLQRDYAIEVAVDRSA